MEVNIVKIEHEIKARLKFKLAPGKGFEPLRARSSPANLPFGLALFVLDLEAGALTTPPPRRVIQRCVCGVKTFPAQLRVKSLETFAVGTNTRTLPMLIQHGKSQLNPERKSHSVFSTAKYKGKQDIAFNLDRWDS